MQIGNPSSKRHILTLAIAALALLGVKQVAAQTEGMGPSEVIRYLTYQSDRPNLHGIAKDFSGIFSCGPALGEIRDNRAFTNTLVNFGPAALPPLEDALASFEAGGERSAVATEAGWLLLAYARLRGPAAYPRLKRMYENKRLDSAGYGLDRAVALAFGFTSYLSARRAAQTFQYYACTNSDKSGSLGTTPCVAPQREQAFRSIHCDRGNEPRDSLDRLILAWLAGNRTSVEASLGGTARSALEEALAGQNWDSLRPRLRTGVSGRSIGMGYRFSISSRWSEPEETLEEQRVETTFADGRDRFEIETLLYDSAGSECGRSRLVFLKVPEAGWYKNGDPSLPVPGPPEYLIDNSDIKDLLRLVSVCSAGGTAPSQVP